MEAASLTLHEMLPAPACLNQRCDMCTAKNKPRHYHAFFSGPSRERYSQGICSILCLMGMMRWLRNNRGPKYGIS